ncbi:MAG: tyrosine-type recombinase/integrase [Lawsonibacter sp.]
MPVDAWYKQWKSLYKDPKGLTAKSLGMYDEKYLKYIKPRIGRLKLKDVKDVHLQRILNEQAWMSASHVKKVRMVMQELFKRARQSRLIVYDPAELLELPTMTEGKRRSVTDEERTAILAVAERHRAGLWILTLLYTGIRPGETAALMWSDVDFERNEIYVHSVKESGSTEIKGPKTAAVVRDIPIHSALRPRLLAAKGEPFSPVFPNIHGTNIHGTNMDDDTLYRRWRSFIRALDIYMGAEVYRNKIVRSVVSTDLTPYCLRHTFCTDLQRVGIPLNVSKELMGHSDVSVTANIYTHKDSGVLHAGIALLDGTNKKQRDRQKAESE